MRKHALLVVTLLAFSCFTACGGFFVDDSTSNSNNNGGGNGGGGGGGTPTVVPKFVYVANFTNSTDPGSASAYNVNSTSGALTAVTGSPFPTGIAPVAIGADSAGKFVYVANQNGGVSAYTINRTNGALVAVTGSPFPTGTEPVSIAVDPNARFVYVADSGSNDIA